MSKSHIILEKLALEPKSFPCHNFQSSPEAVPQTVTAVLVPFKFQPRGDMVIVGWSCNLSNFCCFKYCRYSKVGREE